MVELNRAVAVAEADGAEAGLALIDTLELDDYRYLHAARAELLRRLDRDDEARRAYRAALELVPDGPSGATSSGGWPSCNRQDRRVLDRIHDFRRRLQEAVAERRVTTPHGVGLFCDSIPIVYDVELPPGRPARAGRGARGGGRQGDGALLAPPCDHRRRRRRARRRVRRARLDAVDPSRSWRTGARPDRAVDTSHVHEVPLAALETAHARVTLAEPYGDVELAAQLLEAKRRSRGRRPDAVLRRDRRRRDRRVLRAAQRRRTAQIEDVNTLCRIRGRGLGRAVVQKALDEARIAHDIVFIEALADDWPQDLYSGSASTRSTSATSSCARRPRLSRLRVRTPRLELRLATPAELRELAEVAAAGSTIPADMPFEVAWTDGAAAPGFVDEMIAHHRAASTTGARTDWRSQPGRLPRRTAGRRAGGQSDAASRARARSTPARGSAATHQGRGLGTEMRAAH